MHSIIVSKPQKVSLMVPQNRYFEIIKKICYALHIAYEKYKFIHFDMYPWNIMIRLGDSSPVIIDYGKSMVNDELILEMVNPCSFHDTLTLMMSSLHDLLKYKDMKAEDKKPVKLKTWGSRGKKN